LGQGIIVKVGGICVGLPDNNNLEFPISSQFWIRLFTEITRLV